MILDFGDLPIFDEAVTYPAIVLVEKLSPSPSTSLGDHAQGAAGETLGERSRTRSRTVTHPLPPSGQGRGGETQPDIPALKAEIDRLVHALYGLTDEEIAVVEGKR